MKKQIVAIALIAGLTLATAASADWGRGGKGHGQRGDCPQMQGQMFKQLDQATQDKIKLFFEENQALRKEMIMKRAEKRALMKAQTPDAKAVAQVAGELFDLRTAMHEKAELAGVDQYLGAGRKGCGGPGSGMGRRFSQMNDSVPQQ
jgi:Spy/CpxP family protein refolding chaperone